MPVELVKPSALSATTQVKREGGLQVNLGEFVALSVPQKELYLAALIGDERFAAILPRLQAVLTAEVGAQAVTAPTPSAPTPAPAAKKGLDSQDVAGLLDAVSAAGHGGVDYWVRTTEDVARTTRALGTVVGKLAELEQGTVRKTLEGLASSLAQVTEGGYGGASYWASQAGSIRDTAHDVARQLRSLRDVGTAVLPPKVALALLVDVAKTTSSNGYGASDYWSKAAANAAETAHLVGAGVENIAKQLGEPDRTVIGNIGQRLSAVSSAGCGNSDFWSGVTSDVVKTTRGLAATLHAALGAMA
jgi:hypothetical protein